jgi:hypothetical protein
MGTIVQCTISRNLYKNQAMRDDKIFVHRNQTNNILRGTLYEICSSKQFYCIE